MCAIFVALVLLLAPALARAEAPLVRVIASDFVLPGKFERLARWAEEAGYRVEGARVGSDAGEARDWIGGAALVILDTPRPADLARVQQRLGDALEAEGRPWIRVGGGPPASGGLPQEHARRLVGYYAAGGEANFRAMFTYLGRLRDGRVMSDLPLPQRLPRAGIYHPAARTVFASVQDYLAWGQGRWAGSAPRVAFAISDGVVTDGDTRLVDALIARAEAAGLAPVAFWFDAALEDGLRAVLVPAGADALVNLTHMQNGEARQRELAALGIPVIAAFTWREGDPAAWEASASGLGAATAATLLVTPEAWGMSDPMVVAAVSGGEVVPIPRQVEALMAKLRRLTVLRHRPAAEKRVAAMFWNYPAGEKNLSASNLNLPRSIAGMTRALGGAGYAVPVAEETRIIEAGQAMLGGLYRPEALDGLLRDGLADTIPVQRYRAWLDTLPQARRDAMLERWGAPEADRAVREIDGERRFVIPRLALGNLAILPQPPRSGSPGEGYHDAALPPPHLYMAAYLWVRESWGADALIHLGTHGTQEWLPGKDRGLAAADYPFLALGDLPVLYPYIQDNVGEAMQARRRGRATTISHQTPAFAPSGLYDELRDLHALIHEYGQLEEGAVRDGTRDRILAAVRKASLQRDMGWDEGRIGGDFPGFLSALHDHLHTLSAQAMPLGLHTFGDPAVPEHRLATVIQQLGRPFLERVETEPDEVFAGSPEAFRESAAYRLLHRHLREGVPAAEVTDPDLRALVERAAALDRHLAETGEMEALLTGLAGGFVLPGPGGDPVRSPEVPSGRNLYAFEPDRLPTAAAYRAGEAALHQLVEAYRAEHGGQAPTKLAFSLWSSEAIRHLGVVESQVLHALGLRPEWDAAGRVRRLAIIPAAELGRPRVDVVVQVTSVYRDQFDGFMRLLADAVDRLAALDEPGNAVFANSAAVRNRLAGRGVAPERAATLASARIFSNAPGDYGSGLPRAVLDSTAYENDAPLAERFLGRLGYAYRARGWGERMEGGNLFAEQLRGVQAAVLSRSSNVNGVLSTDHPFEYLGGLSMAVRHLDGASPSLYIADLRRPEARMKGAAAFLSDELRGRYLNPQWIQSMQAEGYAGTLAMTNLANNLFGWQVSDPSMVRPDQWQALHDTVVRDSRNLGLDAWFEQHNPTAQAQVIARMAEAIRKGYWDADARTRQELAERFAELAERHGAEAGAPATRAFLAAASAGFGLEAASAPEAAAQAASAAAPAQPVSEGEGTESVRGQVLQQATPTFPDPLPWSRWAALAALSLCLLAGGARQALLTSRTEA
ncbi:cobaltochelatase subunit CobN [Roseomonas xinghualingensis]|uniref:cobaltochelatase subunit CobN n=1 Tax=Roseomonas xinghualingensis TaxID=2986475 RepID=UPI0021F24747|nr:cobaltochelatase subunit CobN [Roseomonas sp. SXEYE001]MCV4209930.1 cobaltochelatase subunit CobN [Roseomonas sp. SXEYE001]